MATSKTTPKKKPVDIKKAKQRLKNGRKKANAKPSPKQKQAFKALLESKDTGKSTGQVLRENGYTSFANNPSRWLQQPTIQQLCEQFGLTDELILGSITQDIQKKPQNRVQELKLAAQLKGYLTERVDHTSGGMPLVVPNELYEREKKSRERLDSTG